MLIIIILVLSVIAQLFLPWWIVAPIAFFFTFWQAISAGHAFLAGFAGIGLGWLGAALFIDLRTQGVLTGKIASLLHLPAPWLLLLVTALLGGLVGGLSGLAGYFCRRAL